MRILRLVDAVNGPILTGVTGLPMSKLQIDPAPSGVVLPGKIVINRAGDVTSGYPEYSANFTSTYTVREGRLKGLDLGGSLILGWRNRGFYYYPNNYTGASSERTLFFTPTRVSVNPMLAYTHRFRRVTWATRVNIDNLFNHYHVILLPHAVSGWSSVKSTPPRRSQFAIRSPRCSINWRLSR